MSRESSPSRTARRIGKTLMDAQCAIFSSVQWHSDDDDDGRMLMRSTLCVSAFNEAPPTKIKSPIMMPDDHDHEGEENDRDIDRSGRVCSSVVPLLWVTLFAFGPSNMCDSGRNS